MVRIQEAIVQRSVAPNWINLVKLHLAKHEAVSLVAELKGEVIGFFFGQVKHGDFGLEHSGWIEMFGVNPKVMGQGVGRALAQAAFSRFRELGVKDIYTAVRWDYGDILAFFKSIGFNLSDFINLKTRLE
ncbi:MAG: GNAT family N-acetyltransferase [Pseudomonadota bacterium]